MANPPRSTSSPHDPWIAYDRLADLDHAPASRSPEFAALVSEVAEDFCHRWHVINVLRNGTVPRWPDPERDRRSAARVSAAIFATIGVLLLIPIAVSSINWRGGIVHGVGVLALILAVSATVVYLGAVVARRRANRESATCTNARKSCPRCRYDLTGLPDQIPSEWVVVHLGPQRCPECGEPWPMVPRIP